MDPITDMFNRIKNAQAVGHVAVEMPFSNLKYEIAKILEKNNFVEKVEKKGRVPKRVLSIVLKYQDKLPVISGIKRVSKPGQRIYIDTNKIRKVKQGYGITILSTSKGVMSGEEARREKVGGEVLCEVW